MSRPPAILQVLPALVSGGVERGTIEIAEAIAEAGFRPLVASAGGPLVAEVARVGGQHVTLPLNTKSPFGIWRNAAALAALAPTGRVGIVGYCWGGTVAWAAATRIDGLACSAPFYGGGIAGLAGETARCPVEMHFGETDHAIPMTDVEKVKQAQPGITVHVYPAGHGFNCDQRGSYHEPSARLSRERTIAFLRRHVG